MDKYQQEILDAFVEQERKKFEELKYNQQPIRDIALSIVSELIKEFEEDRTKK